MSSFADPQLSAMQTPKPENAPHTVLFSFLSRADDVPVSERRRGPGHLLDQDGEEITDPDVGSRANVFATDPNLSFEQWGEYWRKVHGVRFTYQEDVDDTSLDHLLRYDQIHRLAAGPASTAPLPYRAPVDAEGKLFGTVIGHIPAFVRPRWDGVAYLTFRTPDDIGQVFGTPRVQSKIAPEDKAMFRDVAPMLARQFVLKPSERIEPISLVRLTVRNPNLDRQAFQEQWLGAHADFVLARTETREFVRRYVQLHNVGPTSENEPFYHPETSRIDGVTLMSFANLNDLEAYLLSDGYQAILAAENTIAQAEAAEYWTALNIGIVNAAPDEQRTDRSTR